MNRSRLFGLQVSARTSVDKELPFPRRPGQGRSPPIRNLFHLDLQAKKTPDIRCAASGATRWKATPPSIVIPAKAGTQLHPRPIHFYPSPTGLTRGSFSISLSLTCHSRESGNPAKSSQNRKSPGSTPGLSISIATETQLSKKLRSFLLRLGCFNFRNAFASIWRIRSRVTLNCWPTSSNV